MKISRSVYGGHLKLIPNEDLQIVQKIESNSYWIFVQNTSAPQGREVQREWLLIAPVGPARTLLQGQLQCGHSDSDCRQFSGLS